MRLRQAPTEPPALRLSLATSRPRSNHRRTTRSFQLTPAPVAASSLATEEQQRAHSLQAPAYLQRR